MTTPTDTYYQRMGRYIAGIREAVPMTQRALAARVGGLSRTSVSQIETGRQHATLETLSRICEALNIPMKELLDAATRDDTTPTADPTENEVWAHAHGFRRIPMTHTFSHPTAGHLRADSDRRWIYQPTCCTAGVGITPQTAIQRSIDVMTTAVSKATKALE